MLSIAVAFIDQSPVDSRFKIFSDPVHGFISVPKDLILDLVQTPEVQRLRRIRQLGVGHLVFPGAEHTRFNHALGAMALMHDTLTILADKGTPISPDEHRAALAAALLHDIGHSPFSHTLEHELIDNFHHEQMSQVFLHELNERLGGILDLTLRIFNGTYERPFFHQLVASQLDMDRLDYLRRDSFYTGVVEGRVGVQRILKTMRVHPTEGGPDANIVIESKGIYAIENFLIARRLMYWQVYLHKTVLAGDQLLRAILRRVRRHVRSGNDHLVRAGSEALLYFLENELHEHHIDHPDVIEAYRDLDDTDVIYSLKQWIWSTDSILSDLCYRFINREFFRTTFLPDTPSSTMLQAWKHRIADWLVAEGLTSRAQALDDAAYYLTPDRSRHSGYERVDDSIRILERDGTVRELSETEDTVAVEALTRFVVKPYVCHPKEVDLEFESIA